MIHGTTLVTNAIIERKGAHTALLTTTGFRDAYEIAREHQAEAAAQQQQLDQGRLDDPFGKLPIRGNGSLKPAAHDRDPVARART